MNKDNYKKFIDAVISGDESAQAEAAKSFSIEKTKEILANRTTAKDAPISEGFKQFIKLIKESEYDVSLNGDNVMVNGKAVGKVISDPNTADAILFVSADGRVKKEFNTAQELFDFVEATFLQV